jgi:hypothetical protein
MLITKRDIKWYRNYSAIPFNTIIIPKGTEVEQSFNGFFIKPSFFSIGSIEEHDAIYHGCSVDTDNIIEV